MDKRVLVGLDIGTSGTKVILADQTGKVLAQYGADDAAATREPSGDLVWTQSYDVSGLGEHLTLVLGDYAWNLAQFDLDLSASGT